MPLEDFLPAQVYIIFLVLCRLGATMMLIPGIGDTFVPVRFRLIMAIGLSLVVAPLIGDKIPLAPRAPELVRLIFLEMVVGLYFGIVARILVLTMDTAGQIIALNIGLANAQVFNPAIATQGSLPGFFLLNIATLLLLITDMHHLLIHAMIDSYSLFPQEAPFRSPISRRRFRRLLRTVSSLPSSFPPHSLFWGCFSIWRWVSWRD